MQFAAVKPNNIAVVRNGSLVIIGDALAKENLLPAEASMIDLIARYENLRSAISRAAESSPAIPTGPGTLKAPIAEPSKIWAAATNYRRGSAGLEDARGRGTAPEMSPQEILEMAFLKPPSAIIGPEEAIVIPDGGGSVFPELELCVVIGKKCRNASRAEALDAIFGYTIMLDVTARGAGWGKALTTTRCVRKGFDTFAPIGPWITTKDEIGNPQNLWMRLTVNGEVRQSARTNAMIHGVEGLVSYLSRISTLYPGDLISTGNPDDPAFQMELKAGDALIAEIGGIGALNLSVKAAG
jgi:2-keto-4-pentenoate hydratase/2-oxohepta-3-ene-1,7-dioic acid hydratase in catechol pathway